MLPSLASMRDENTPPTRRSTVADTVCQSAEAAFGIAEARRRMVEVDPQAQAALASFGEAEKLPGLVRN